MNIVALLRSIKTFFIQLNLFESIESRSNAHYSRTTIIATRLYIVVMTFAILAVVFLTAFNQQIQTVTVQNPTKDVYQELYTKYSTTLQCPCKQIEIPYKTFVNISYMFHPVCSSVFVSKSWIDSVFRDDMGYYFPFDFRSAAPGHFQLLASLCSFASRIVQDAIDDSLSVSLLTSQTISEVSLEAQGNSTSDFLRRSTAYAFRRLITVIRDATQMNGLQPAMQTSKMHLMHVFPNETVDVTALETIWPGDMDDSECFCGVTSNCYSPIGFFDVFAEETQGLFFPSVDPSVSVTGFTVGCYALDGLLHSTLECFYSVDCLTALLTYFPTSNITSQDVLDTNQTQYSPEETIERIVDDLFLEQWSPHISFASYYSTCAPLLCIYKVTQYGSFLQILTTLLGLYGGLTVVFRLVVLQIVNFWRNYRMRRQTQLDAAITVPERLRNIQKLIMNRLFDFNLFRTDISRTDPYEHRTGIIATRIYLLVLTFALATIMAYLSASVRVHSNTIEKPSRLIFENLYQKYTITLQCPCSHIANGYALFTSISPVFHPVCSSLYVSDQWIISISGLNDMGSLYDAIDFRTAGPTFFNTLTTLCSLTNTTIADAWYMFGQTQFITDLTLIESEFQTRTKLAIDQFQENTISQFNRMLSLVELHSKAMYDTGYNDHILIPIQSSDSAPQIDYQLVTLETNNCSCSLDNDCIDVMSFFTYTDLYGTIYADYYLNFTISDMFIGCYVVPSVQRSSLGCFFNQTCLDLVQREVNSSRSINISILDDNSTRFRPDTLIGTIVENMMIEQWNEQMNYFKYFELCDPEKCVYTYTASLSFLYTITTMFGLFGGLSVAFRITVHMIVRMIRNKRRVSVVPTTITVQPSNAVRGRVLVHTVKSRILDLNLFKTELSWDDDRRRRREILTTRVYLVLLVVCNVILIMYNLIEIQTQISNIPNPTREDFEQFRLKVPSSSIFDCPCENILISHQSFISIRPHFHQLCSSDFITPNFTWFTRLESSTTGILYPYNDYRRFAASQFYLLQSLCTLARDTVTESVREFSRNALINERVQSRESIESQANSTLNRFRLSTPRTFVRNLDFVLSMAQGNGILSYILSNWHFVSSDEKFEYATIWPLPYSYGHENCSCATNARCVTNASMDELIIPGFYVGCYPLESLLQSTLECLYNISCIDVIKSIGDIVNYRLNPLDASLSNPKVTVQTLVDNLLIERWETNMSYEQYYNTCAPVSCTYSFDGRISLVYTIATIIGLQGGLSLSLKLFVPMIITIGYGIVSYRYRRFEQVVAMITMTGENRT